MRRPCSAGFTLVEVLVALAIVALLLGVVHELLATTVRQKDLIEAAEEARIARGTLAEMLSRDLAGLYPAGRGVEPALTVASSRGYPTSSLRLSFATASPGLRFPRTQEPIVHRVLYRLVPSGETGLLSLWRAEQPFPDPERKPTDEVLLTDGLARFEVSVFDGANWVDQWPAQDEEGLPRALRIRFAWAGAGSGAPVTILKTIDVSYWPKAGTPVTRRGFGPGPGAEGRP